MQVQGGNWQIFQKMVEASGATVNLNSPVIGLEKSGSKYAIQIISRSSNATYQITFDKVILANPFQFSDIDVGSGVLTSSIESVPYVQLHVTIFASPKRLKSQYFKWPGFINVPTGILTTLAKTDNPNSGPQGVGKAGFFSCTILRTAINPATNKQEYIYKIFSPEALTPPLLRYAMPFKS